MDILVIEDEKPAAQELQRLIMSIQPEARLVGHVSSNKELKKWTQSNDWPDLIFSDIELLDGPVFDALSELNPTTPIIFTTAYDHYMEEAFNSTGISYILKPYDTDQVEKAIQKYELISKKSNDVDWEEIGKTLGKQLIRPNYKSRFTIKKGGGMYFVDAYDIVCVKMRNGVLRLLDHKGIEHLTSMTLSEFMNVVDPDIFFQLNRSEGISWEHLERMESYGKDRLAIYIKGQPNPLISSAAKTPLLRKWIEK